MSALRRLSRLEWAERDEPSPLADPEATALLEEVALELGKQGRVRLARLDDAQGEAVRGGAGRRRWRSRGRARDGGRSAGRPARARRACSTPRRSPRARAAASRSTSSPAPASTRCRRCRRRSSRRSRSAIWGQTRRPPRSAARCRSVAPARPPRPRDAGGRRGAGPRRVDADPHRRRERRALRSLLPVSRPAVDARHRGRRPASSSSVFTEADYDKLDEARRAELHRAARARRGDRPHVLAARRSGRARDARRPARRHRVGRARTDRGARARPHAADVEVRRVHPQRVRRARRARPRRRARSCSSTSPRSCARPTPTARGR